MAWPTSTHTFLHHLKTSKPQSWVINICSPEQSLWRDGDSFANSAAILAASSLPVWCGEALFDLNLFHTFQFLYSVIASIFGQLICYNYQSNRNLFRTQIAPLCILRYTSTSFTLVVEEKVNLNFPWMQNIVNKQASKPLPGIEQTILILPVLSLNWTRSPTNQHLISFYRLDRVLKRER